MALLHHLARPMLASIFVVAGAETMVKPEARAETAKPVTDRLRDALPWLPDDPQTLVRVNGAVQLVSGAALATGRLPRLAALVLAGSLVPTTAAGHRFWELKDSGSRRQQRTHLLKNVAILGGLLFAASDRGGAPSLGWRAARAVRKAPVPLP
jgi:putative oxidoreductase